VLTNEELSAKVMNMDSEILELRGRTTPWGLSEQIEQLGMIIDRSAHEFSLLKQKQKKMEENAVEEVTNKELTRLWIQTGVPQKNIAKKFNIDESNAHNWVHGKLQDKRKRHLLKLFLLEHLK